MNDMNFANVNLLPDRKKNNLEKLIRFIFFKEIIEVALLVSAFLAMMLLWGYMILQEHFNDLSTSALSVNREFSRYNQEVRKINLTIKSLNFSGKNFYPLTPQLNSFFSDLSKDIKINSFNLDRETGMIDIAGTAKTRQTLLNFQDQLSGYSYLEKVEAPISQLFQKENINFEIRAKTKNVPLLK